MARKRPPQHRPHGARSVAGRAGGRGLSRPAPSWLAPALVFGVPVLAALWVHRGALGAYFTTDDLILFERAGGVAPFPATLWRWISGHAYFRMLWPVFGIEPFGWHLVGWLLHGVATLLVAVWARRLGANRTAAALAALLFGTTARARTVVWQVTGIGESLGAVFALLALVSLADVAPRFRRAAAAWHAAALLSMESVALAPLAALAGAPPGASVRLRLREVGLALGLSAALWIYLLLARGSTGSLGGEAYAFGFGPHVLEHLFTYTLWSADPVHLADAIPIPPPLPWAVVAIAILAALVLYAYHSHSRPARAGLVLWFATLLPVLPLVHAVYPHYLYLPRAGFAVALAAVVAGGKRRRVAYALAGFLAVVHGMTANMYLDAMRDVRVSATDLPRDPFLRDMDLIRNAAESVQGRFGTPVRLAVFTPPGSERSFDARTGAAVTDTSRYAFRHELVQATLDGGRGLRALEPEITAVRFARHASPADSGWVLATNLGDGRLEIHGLAPRAEGEMAEFWATHGYPAQAAAYRAEVARLDSLAAARRSAGVPAAGPGAGKMRRR